MLGVVGLWVVLGNVDCNLVTLINGEKALYLDGNISTTYGHCEANYVFIRGTSVIPEDTFNGMTSLHSLSFPRELTYVGPSAFEGCVNLKVIPIPDNDVVIGDSAFVGFDGNFMSGRGGVDIGDNAFKNGSVYALRAHNISSIGAEAFRGTTITFVDVYDGTQVIGANAFVDGIECITLPYIDDNGVFEGSFIGCGRVTQNAACWEEAINEDGVYTLPGGVIPYQAFKGCPSLKEIDFNGSTIIGEESFAYLRQITNVVVPNSVTMIDDTAFAYSTLVTVSIASSVWYIGTGAFLDCSRLEVLEIFGAPSFGSFPFAGTNINSFLLAGGWDTTFGVSCNLGCGCLHLAEQYSLVAECTPPLDQCNVIEDPRGRKMLYIDGNITNTYSECDAQFVFIRNTTRIPGGAFQGMTSLTYLSLPDELTYIGPNAFKNCSNLTTLALLSDFVEIDDNAFTGAFTNPEATYTGVMGINVTVGGSSFKDTDLLVVSLYNLISVEDEGFRNARLFYAFLYTRGNTIGEAAFEDNECVASKYIDEGRCVNSLPSNNCWENATIIDHTTYVIPYNTSIPDTAFRGCQTLKAVIFNGTTAIGAYSFRYTPLLDSVVIPSPITFIDVSAFASSAVQSVEIGSTITYIGGSAFGDCLRLHTLIINGNPEYGGNVFSYTSIHTFLVEQTFSYDGHEDRNCIDLVSEYTHVVECIPVESTTTVSTTIGSSVGTTAKSEDTTLVIIASVVPILALLLGVGIWFAYQQSNVKTFVNSEFGSL